MENLHNSVMINEIISFLPLKKSINVIDATFGGGGYSKTILEKFNVNQLLAIDRDPISKIFAKELEIKFPNFTLINDCLLYTSPSPRDAHESRMPSSA